MPLWYDDAAAGRSLRAAPLGAQLSGSLFVPEGGFWHDKLWFLVQQVCWARIASVAQLVEQLSCKQQVTGSSPAGGSTTTYISGMYRVATMVLGKQTREKARSDDRLSPTLR